MENLPFGDVDYGFPSCVRRAAYDGEPWPDSHRSGGDGWKRNSTSVIQQNFTTVNGC